MPYFQFGHFSFNRQSGELIVESKTVTLRNKVAELLLFFLENPDVVLSKEDILTQVWQGSEVVENTLNQAIKELRMSLSDSAKSPVFIKTYPRRGYSWIYTNIKLCSKDEFKTSDTQSKSPANLIITISDNKASSGSSTENTTKTALLKMANNSLNFKTLASLFFVLLLSLSYYFISATNDRSDNKTIVVDAPIRLAIMPFINNSLDKELDWLELGVRRVLVSPLDEQGIYIAPLAETTEQLGQQDQIIKEIDYPKLFKMMMALQVDHLLKAEITKVDDEYSINYRLFNIDGSITGKTLFSSELLSLLPELKRDIQHNLNLTVTVKNIERLSDNDEANLDFVKGLQTLNKQGPLLAKQYFQAAVLRDEAFDHAKVYLALSVNLLGNWQQSKQLWMKLRVIAQEKQDQQLNAWAVVGLAYIAEQQGDSSDVLALLNNIATTQQALSNEINTHVRLLKHRALLNLAQDKAAFKLLNNTSPEAVESFQQRAEQLYSQASVPPLSVSEPKENKLKIKQQVSVKAYYSYLGSAIGALLSFESSQLDNIAQLEKAHNYYQLLGDLKGQAKTLVTLSYFYQREPQQEWKLLAQSLKLYKQLAMPSQVITVLYEMSATAMRLKQPELALSLAKEVLEKSTELGALSVIANIHHDIALYYLEMSTSHERANPEHTNLNKAAVHIKASLTRAGELQREKLINDNNFLLAVVNIEKGKVDNDEVNYLTPALDFYQQRQDHLSVAVTQYYQIKNMMLLKQWHNAQQQLKQLLNQSILLKKGYLYPEYFSALVDAIRYDLAICQVQLQQPIQALTVLSKISSERLITSAQFIAVQSAIKHAIELKNETLMPMTPLSFYQFSRLMRDKNTNKFSM